MQLTWFRSPSDDDPGTTNLCYLAVDALVVHGRAGDIAVRQGVTEVDYAALLEQVAALAGAMSGVGVTPGSRVATLLDDPLDQLLATLAALRVGAAHVCLPHEDPAAVVDTHQPALVATGHPLTYADHTPVAAFLRGVDPQDASREVEWDIAIKAGRTDPAGVEPVTGDSVAYVTTRPVTVREVPEDDSILAGHLRDLARGRTIRLGDTLTGGPR